LMPLDPRPMQPGVIALRTDSSGHFRTTAEINGHSVVCLVDTGASDVTLPAADARRVGFDPDTLNYNVPYRTANGSVFGARIRLARVKVGDITFDGVAGSVVKDGRLDQCLLGMSFLNRLAGYEVRGRELILRE
jgi:aspartyl protease family protein